MVKYKLLAPIPLAGFDQFLPGGFIPEDVFRALTGEQQAELVEILIEEDTEEDVKKKLRRPVKEVGVARVDTKKE